MFVMADFNKIVIVTQKTWLEMLIERFNTKEQAKFYIKSIGGNFTEYEASHNTYYTSLQRLKRSIPKEMRYQIVERSFLPNFLFGPKDLVVTLGRDGLVINTAKYLNKQVILPLNPDPSRVDGILIHFTVDDFKQQLKTIMQDREKITKVSLVEANLTTKERIIGVNDLFIGHKSHQSARYSITYRNKKERHISSGIIVSTGIGSTGWYKSIVTGAVQLVRALYATDIINITEKVYRFSWEADYLVFSVREPWKSRTSGASIVWGRIERDEVLEIESEMPENGIIFSDGMESDFIEFNAGTIARIGLSDKKAHIVTK